MVREARAVEQDRIWKLWVDHFGQGARVTEIYEWRERPDSPARNYPWVAVEGDTIAGVINTSPMPITYQGERIAAAWHLDSMVSPTHRGKGIGSSLLAHAGRTAAFVAAKGTVENMYRLRKRTGYVDVPNCEYLQCCLRPWQADGPRKRRLLQPALWLRSLLGRRPGAGTLEIRPLEAFGPEFDALAARMALRPVVLPEKGSAYLRWRYQTCPGRAYTILGAWRDGQCVGAVVTRAPKRRFGTGVLLDVIADPEDTAAVDALVRAGLQALHAAGASSVVTLCTYAPLRARLARAGFWSTNRTPHFTILVHAALPFDPARADWLYWHGDGDSEVYD